MTQSNTNDDAVDRWLSERPILSAFDDSRQFSTAMLAWKRRSPHNDKR